MPRKDLGIVIGPQGKEGPAGPMGPKPVKGVDYYTEEEKQEFVQSINTTIAQEGNKQVTAVRNQGNTSLQAVTKVQTDIEALLNNQEAEGNALSLNGKTGVQYDKEIQGAVGQCDGTFPLTTAEVNKVYLVPQTGKFYKCKTAYNGTQISAPNSNFEDLSVLENRNKLDNLTECFETYDNASDCCLSGEPYKTIQINGKTKYIGFTKDLDAKKASMLHYKIDGEEYALRKYKGKTSMYQYFKRKYPNTYNTISDINDSMIEDTGDCYELDSFFNGCSSATSFPQLDTTNGTLFNSMFNGCSSATSFPQLDTTNGTRFDYMFNGCSSATSFPQLDTTNGTRFNSMFNGCSSATSFPQLDTTNGTRFDYMFNGCKIRQATLNTEDGFYYNAMFYNCKEIESVSDINLSSVTIGQINGCLNNMFFNCEKLANVKFVECPVGTNTDSLKQIIKVPSSCNVIVEERKPRTNFEASKVIKVENMKLIEIDNNSGISIKRKGNKPLDSYIVNSGEWGTIYDDKEQFRIFVTKDNLIYLGTAYNSSKRTEVQPEIPEGIEVPDSCLIIEKEDDFKNVSFILKDFTPGFGQINQVNRYFPIEWGGPWIDYVPTSYSPVDIYFSWKNAIMEIKSATQRGCMTKSYFKITVGSQFQKPNTTSAIYLYNDVLYEEEFDSEIKKIKQ